MSTLYLALIPLNFIPGWCSFPPITSLECACICAQTRPIHAGDRHAGGNAIQGEKCVAMTAVAFFYGVNVTMSSIVSMAATSGAAVRALPLVLTAHLSFPFLAYSYINDDKRFLIFSLHVLILTMTNVLSLSLSFSLSDQMSL